MVSLFFVATHTDDMELFQSIIAKEFLGDCDPLNHGLDSLAALAVYQLSGDELVRHLDAIFAGETARELGIQREDIAIIGATYEAHYDGRKTHEISGVHEWTFTVYRQGPDKPWKISNLGVGYGGL